MQAGTYTAGETLRAVVTIDGARVDDDWIRELTLDAELVTHLPGEQGTGMSARHGTLVMGPRPGVWGPPPSPLRRDGVWPPQRGQQILIWTTTDSQQWRRATATITSVTAGLGEHDVSVSWRDAHDSLDQVTTLPPMAVRMPGEEISVGGVLQRPWRRAKLEPWAVAVEAFEDAGYRILPSLPETHDFYALFQGTANPRIGYISSTPEDGELLEWDPISGFQYLAQWSYFSPGYGERDFNECMTVFMRATRAMSAQTRWTMADGAEIRIIVSATSTQVVRIAGGVTTVIAQQGYTSDSPLPWIGVSIATNSLVLWHEDGALYVAYSDLGLSNFSIDWQRVRAYGAAALQVVYRPRSGWNAFSWPSLRFRSAGPWLVRATQCTRTIEAQPIGAVLDDIAAAAVCALWHDELGIAHLVPTSLLTEAAPVETIDAAFDALAGAWTEDDTGVHSAVTVRRDEVALSMSPEIRVVLLDEAGGKTLVQGDVVTDPVGPGGDEEWIQPDMNPLPASTSAELLMQRGVRSMWGGSFLATEGHDSGGGRYPDADTFGWAMDRGWLGFDIRQVSPRQWFMTHNVGTNTLGEPPAGPIELRTLPGQGTQVPVAWRGKSLPVFRGRGKAAFASAQVTVRQGPSWAPVLEHDLGAWGNLTDAQRIAAFLAGVSDHVRASIQGLSVWPDPRRQLGDVVLIDAGETLGGVLRCLIVGLHERTVPGVVPEQVLDLIVLDQTSDEARTYAVLEDSASSYASLEDAHANYQQMEG